MTYADQLWNFFVWEWEKIGKAFAKPQYSVTEWGSNPDEEDNDDCWSGEDYLTNSEASTAFLLAVANADKYTAYVMLDGPDIHLVAKNPKFKKSKVIDADASWKHEMAMEAGMLHGVEAYNDEMGY